MQATEWLALRGVSKSYGPVRVLEPTDLSVREGEFLTLLGPSGSGKTTILRMIAGFVQPSAGHIVFAGRDITALPAHLRPFNTVFQDYALFPHMSVAANVGYGPMVRGRSKGEIGRLVRDTLQIVGLGDMLDRRPAQLSGGQRQRVALARAIVNEPQVILLDEPLGALDAGLRRQMQLFLKDLQQRIRITFVFVTHDQEEAITMSDRIVVMTHGRIAQIGTPTDIYRAPANLFVAGFFGDNNLLSGQARADGTVVTEAGVLRGPAGFVGQVTAAVRPELISLRPDEPGGTEDGLRGRILRVIFTGAALRVEVAAGDLAIVVKLSGAAAAAVPPVGAAVRLTVPPEAIHLLAAA